MIRRALPHDVSSFDDAWTSGDLSSLDAATADLVRTAQALTRAASAAEPTPEFRAELRDTLMTEAANVLVATPPKPAAKPALALVEPTVDSPHSLRRRVVGLSAAFVTALGSVGMVASSATAVPGDVLYPVKQGIESVQLALHRGDTSRGEFQLNQARERLAEAAWLDSHDKDDRVAGALENFADQASAGSTSMFDAYDAERDTATISAVNDFAAGAAVTLATLSEDLPDDAKAAVDLAADTLTGLASQASLLCAVCSPAELGSLIDAIDAAVSESPASPTTADPAPDSSSGSVSQPESSSNQGSSGSPAAPPATTTPAPKAPPTPSLKELTDPLIGGLLGDEEQEGLVPSILGGLGGIGGGK